MKFEQYQYRISSHYLPALINGDESGMSDEESEMLNAFYASLPGYGHWDCEDDSSFAECEVSGLYADTVVCTYHIPVTA